MFYDNKCWLELHIYIFKTNKSKIDRSQEEEDRAVLVAQTNE